ncbi:MAG: hypothetical protein K0S61_1631 [Anaerocolumna sp.]|jgi:hypothetical protein|nr:hypothetical protein [Anaerocolumna sp.]
MCGNTSYDTRFLHIASFLIEYFHVKSVFEMKSKGLYYLDKF